MPWFFSSRLMMTRSKMSSLYLYLLRRGSAGLKPLHHRIDRGLLLAGHVLKEANRVLLHLEGSVAVRVLGVVLAVLHDRVVAEVDELLGSHHDLGRVDLMDAKRLLGVLRVDERLRELLDRLGRRGNIGNDTRATAARRRLLAIGTAQVAVLGILILKLRATLRLLLVAVAIGTVGTDGDVLTLLLAVLLVALTRSALSLFLLLLLLAPRLHVVDALRDLGHIIEGDDRLDLADDLLLLGGEERNLQARVKTHLEVEVDAVDEREGLKRTAFDLEEVHLAEGLVADGEVAAKARELALDHLLNARVLNHIDEVLSDTRTLSATDAVGLGLPLVGGSVQGMRDLMADQEVEDLLAVLANLGRIPRRQDEGTRVEIERCTRDAGRVRHGDVLTRKHLREIGRGFEVARDVGLVFHTHKYRLYRHLCKGS
jgi:hypothetical protein